MTQKQRTAIIALKSVPEQIISIEDGMYYAHSSIDNDIEIGGDIESIDKEYHLWTIEDARDGDVLYDGNNACIFRKKMKDDDAVWVDAYCGVDSDGMFNVNDKNECWCLACDCVPANQEQRETLFQKMKDAGYEFDFDKKKLKKIKEIIENK